MARFDRPGVTGCGQPVYGGMSHVAALDPDNRSSMHPVLSQKRADIVSLCRRHPVRRLEVFGSAARGDDFDPDHSDADFLVEFTPDAKRGLEAYFALKADLERLLGRPVDLVEPAVLRNPYVLEGVNSSRELVYAA